LRYSAFPLLLPDVLSTIVYDGITGIVRSKDGIARLCAQGPYLLHPSYIALQTEGEIPSIFVAECTYSLRDESFDAEMRWWL
jgi:hypothetical protein